MKKIFMLFVATVIFSVVYSDQIELLNSYWDFYSENNNDYHSMGLGLATVADIGGAYSMQINPASLNTKYHSIYVSIGSKSKFILQDTLVISAKQPIINFGYATGIKKIFNVGFYYDSTKNFKIYNKSELDTPYLAKKKFFFKETGYALAFNFVKYPKIRIGASLQLKGILLDEETEASIIDRFKDWQFGATIGAIILPLNNLNLGLTYSLPTKKDISVRSSDNEDIFYATKVYPQKFSASMKYHLARFNLYYAFTYVNTSADFYNLDDMLNHHVGIKYTLNKSVDLLGGFFSKFSYYGYQSYNEIPDILPIDNEYFFTTGINLKTDNFLFGFSIMDSHISGDTTPKTYFSFGFSYSGETLF